MGARALPLPRGGAGTCVILLPTTSPRGGRGSPPPLPTFRWGSESRAACPGHPAERGRSRPTGPHPLLHLPHTHSHLPSGSLAGADLLSPAAAARTAPRAPTGLGLPERRGLALLTRGAPPAARSSPCCPRPLEWTVPTPCGLGGLFYLDAAWTARGQPATEARPWPSRGPSCSPPCDFPVSLQRDSARHPVVGEEYF